MASPRRKPADPSITIPLTGGSISITAAGPMALIRAFTPGREQVVLRATIEQLAELVDAAIARRSAMAKDRDRRRGRAEAVDRSEAVKVRAERPTPIIEEDDVEIEPPAVVLPPPRVTAREPDDILASAPEALRQQWARPARSPAPEPVAAPRRTRATPDALAAAENKPARKKRSPAVRASREVLANADGQIRDLHARGWTDTAIAKAVGVSVSFARLRRIAMGLAVNFKSAIVERRAA